MTFLSGRTSLTTVQTADLADNSVTLAKLAHGTASQNIAYDSSGVPVDVATTGDGALNIALSSLALTLATTDFNTQGAIGTLYLADDFESDSLATKTNAIYDATLDAYKNPAQYSSTNINPVLSGYSGGGLTVSATFERSGGYYAWEAFDNDYNNEWDTWNNGEVHNLTMVYDAAQTVARISIGKEPNGINYLPQSFTFEGSNDGSTWVTLLTVTGFTAYSVGVQQTFDLTTTGSYTQYRLACTDSVSSTYIAIGKFECFELLAVGNVTLAPTAAALAVADPSDLAAYIVIDPKVSFTAGTDIIFKGSIDGNVTKTAGSWTKIGDLTSDGKELWKIDVNVDSQSGSSLSWELTTVNNKEIYLVSVIGIIPT